MIAVMAIDTVEDLAAMITVVMVLGVTVEILAAVETEEDVVIDVMIGGAIDETKDCRKYKV